MGLRDGFRQLNSNKYIHDKLDEITFHDLKMGRIPKNLRRLVL
jgi:hypothetical protein